MLDPRRPLIIRGGLVLDATGFLGAADILVRDGVIDSVGARIAAPEDAGGGRCFSPVAASGVGQRSHARAREPVAVDGRSHHAGTAIGIGATHVAVSERRGKARIGDHRRGRNAAEVAAACYDLFVEFPFPTEEGIAAVADAYAQAGMRAVIAPMMADMTFYEAIPGLMDALSSDLQKAVAPLGLPPWQQTLEHMRGILRNWRADRAMVLAGGRADHSATLPG